TGDGSFGAGTQAATVALQSAAGLAPDGVVGPTTRQALQQQLKNARSNSTGGTAASAGSTLKLGDTGQDVVDWQTKLNQWLRATAPSQAQIATDGSFGQATMQATEQLQTAAGQTPTGQVDAATRQALASALANAGPNRGPIRASASRPARRRSRCSSGLAKPAPIVTSVKCVEPRPRHSSAVLRQSSGSPSAIEMRCSIPNRLQSRPASSAQARICS